MKYFLQKLMVSVYIIAILSASCTNKKDEAFSFSNRERDFSAGWLFMRDSLSGAESINFDDAQWAQVKLPHDYSIEDLPGQDTTGKVGPFSIKSPGATSTGYVLGGTGWYRKHFTLDEKDNGKIVKILFDGVYMESDVWLNGHHLGFHPYGYTPFFYDLTPHLKPAGQENILAVRVHNTGRNSRWYSGSGIYRDVQLLVTNPLHVAVWGVYITTPAVSGDSAQIKVNIALQNNDQPNNNLAVKTKILDKDGASVAEIETKDIAAPKGQTAISQNFSLKSPKLWSVDSPHLYKAEISIIKDGKTIDAYVQNFGVRSIEYSAKEGFKLNGQPLEMKGACMHHDNGLLGAAAFKRAEERRVEIMKANGYNAIRCSHNPPSAAFLDACDKLGMLVIDEAFDMWEHPKNPMDYHRFFKEYSDKDLKAMLLRDRNHPSVVLWSIGNEIYERADTSGVRIGKRLAEIIHQVDSTRPVNAAICHFWDQKGKEWPDVQPAFTYQDVAGYNYKYEKYEADHQEFPDRIMVGTESVPILAYENWKLVEQHPYIIGDFVWTGMDYLGETGIGHSLLDTAKERFSMEWPWYNAWCGDIDICGFKKPQSYYRDVLWGNSMLEMAVHVPLPAGRTERLSNWGWPNQQISWTWPGNEGKTMDVSVYSSAEVVRLQLNGKEIAEQKLTPDAKLTAKFKVPYQAGELKAVAIKNGQEVATKILKTAGAPAALRLVPDRETIKNNSGDLSFITVEVIDKDGNLVPHAAIPVQYSVSGEGTIAAAGNAAPADMHSFRKLQGKTYNGKSLIIIRPTAKAGQVQVTAQGEGFKAVTTSLTVEKQ